VPSGTATPFAPDMLYDLFFFHFGLSSSLSVIADFYNPVLNFVLNNTQLLSDRQPSVHALYNILALLCPPFLVWRSAQIILQCFVKQMMILEHSAKRLIIDHYQIFDETGENIAISFNLVGEDFIGILHQGDKIIQVFKHFLYFFVRQSLFVVKSFHSLSSLTLAEFPRPNGHRWL